MSQQSQSGGILATGIVLALTIMLVVVMMLVVGLVISQLGFFGDTTQVDPRPAGTFVTVDDRPDVPGRVDVDATTENALRFDGDSDNITASEPANLTGAPWTVCAGAELADDTNLDATFDIAAFENESILLQYDAGHWLVYYNNSTADGKDTIDAPSPRSMTFVCGRWNGTHLQIFRDGTPSSSPATLTASVTSRNVSQSWHGRLDEIRAYEAAVSDSGIQHYADHPVLPILGVTPAGRLMLDEGSGRSTKVYFAGVDADVHGASWTSGLPDESYQRGSDYELRGEPFSVRAVQGGDLDGAPVLYLEYSSAAFVGLLPQVVVIGGTGFVLFLLAALFVPVVGLLAYVKRHGLLEQLQRSPKR